MSETPLTPDPVPPGPPTETPPLPTQTPAPEPVSVFDPRMFPSRRRPLLQFILDHNPLLLLSTVLMLLGCYLINSSIDLYAGDTLRLLALLGVINIYEACIIPLGLILIRRSRGTARDGLWLLLFETLFLVNGTFLNVDPHLLGGWWLNLGILLLALIKAAVLMRGLKLGFGLRTFGFMAAQLGLIYLLPIFFSFVSIDGVVPANVMYLLWWVVGLLPVAYDLVARADAAPAKLDLVQTVIRRTYLIAPWVMLVIHLRFSHWAHHCDFVWADAAPILLGLTIAAARVRLLEPVKFATRLLPVVALLLTIGAPSSLEWPAAFMPSEAITPAGLVCVGVLMTYSYLVSLWAAATMSGVLLLGFMTYLAQDWIFALLRFVVRQIARVLNLATEVLPRTASSWGVLAVLAAFILLAIGARLSLKRSKTPAP